MLQSSISKIERFRDSFEDIKSISLLFAKSVNEDLDNGNEEANTVFVEDEFPPKRIRRVKKRPGEKASDEPIKDNWRNYKITQFLVIADSIGQELKSRYNDEEGVKLIKEMSFFQPKKFGKLSDEVIELPFVSKVLNISETSLIEKLKQFADTFNQFKPKKSSEHPIRTDYGSEEENVSSEDEDDDDDHKCKENSKKEKKSCNNCTKCCFEFLIKFNLNSSAYTNVFRVYEYFLTLPCTQVECERAFSKLKLIKSRLRSSLKQKLLEALMLMSAERELTFRLDVDKIVRLFASSTTELTRFLIE